MYTLGVFAIYGKNGEAAMTQRTQRVNWNCQRMKNQMSGIERRILAVPQEAPRGVPPGRTQEAANNIYYTIGIAKY